MYTREKKMNSILLICGIYMYTLNTLDKEEVVHFQQLLLLYFCPGKVFRFRTRRVCETLMPRK